MAKSVDFKGRKIKGILLDITGVLYESGAGPISGSVEAVQRLKSSGIPVRFCTNETTTTRQRLVEKLQGMGFSMGGKEVFPPIPAVCHILKARGLRPHLLVDQNALPDFAEVDQNDPNCVVLGDATTQFSYENLNKTFQILMSLKTPKLFALGKGKYYQDGGKLVLDVGSYTKALEYACDIEAEIVGKPSPAFFNAALEDIGVSAENALMVGDDIVNDVGGAQACGMLGIQVRTGKFRPQDENHPTVKPDAYVDNLAAMADLILKT